MQKTDFIKVVADRAGVSQKMAREVVDEALALIAETLRQDEKVTLTGFGTFEVRQRQERMGVNPQTRDRIRIDASRTPGFSASSTLKDMIKGSGGSFVGAGSPGYPGGGGPYPRPEGLPGEVGGGGPYPEPREEK